MGAGILPVALYKGTVYVLLGQERYNNNLWVDFGGSSYKNERNNPFKTAIREGSEELNGLYGTEEILNENVQNNLLLTITSKNDRYTTYIFETIYNDYLPIHFQLQNQFFEKHLNYEIRDPDNGLFEKINIKWFSIRDLDNPETKKIIRPYYNVILETIVKQEKLIKSKLLDSKLIHS